MNECAQMGWPQAIVVIVLIAGCVAALWAVCWAVVEA